MSRKAASLDKVQLSYIRSQMYKISAEEIATDLNLPLNRVKRQVELFRQEDEKAGPKTPPEGAGQASRKQSSLDRFSVVSGETGQPIAGVAVMTPQQSQQDDADLGASPFGCAGLTEAQRAYVKDKMGQLTPDQIAKDCGLPAFVVRQIIESSNLAQVGREKFYERHRNNIHKIRPDEPIR